MLAAAVAAAVAAPVSAQTLAQRMEAVKKKNGAEQTSRRVTPARVKMLQTLFYGELTFNFDETPARDVFEYFKTALGVNLIGRYSDDPVGHGIDPETPITLAGEKMIAVEMLDLVLEQCSAVDECTWQLRRSFLEVGTKDRLTTPVAQVLRVYPIDDMLFEAPRFTDAFSGRLDYAFVYPWHDAYAGRYYNGYASRGYGGSVNPAPPAPTTSDSKEQRAQSLVEFIVEVIEPAAWARNGGQAATIRYRDGSLVVRAPDYIQRQIGGYPRVPPPPVPGPKETATPDEQQKK
jgi:hypothetical protein